MRNYRVSKMQVPFLKLYFLLLLGQYFQNLCVWFNPGTGDNHIILLVDQNSAHIAHTSQMFKITQYFSDLEYNFPKIHFFQFHTLGQFFSLKTCITNVPSKFYASNACVIEFIIQISI